MKWLDTFNLSMTTIQNITTCLEKVAPLHYQAAYDNAGLIIGDSTTVVKGILIALDITPDVIEEALAKKCNLIIGHHPPIFHSVKKLTGNDIATRTMILAIQHDIALYAIHTNLDYVEEGVNKALGERLQLTNLAILQPAKRIATGKEQVIGAGMIGELTRPLSEQAFLAHLKKCLQLTCIRYYSAKKNTIKQVAICGGAGIALLPAAKASQADAFVTADIKYHQFFDANGELLLADVGHYESEIVTKKLIYTLLSNKFANIALFECSTITNPIQFFI